MNFEKLVDALTEGDDMVEVHIKQAAEEGCEECDSCAKKEKEEDDGLSFMDLIKMLASDDEDSENTKEDGAEAAEAYRNIVESEGVERADDLVEMARCAGMINSLLQVSAPIRVSDVEKYNTLLDKIYPDRKDSLATQLLYACLDHSSHKAAKDIRK